MNKLTRILGALFIIAALFFSQAFWLDSGRVNADGLDGTGKILPSIPQEAKGNPKLDSYLNRLVSNNTSQVQFYGQQQVNPNTVVRVIVDCQPGKPNTVTQAMGSYVTVEQTYGNMLQATVPVSRLNFLAALTDVRKVSNPQAPLPLSITGEEVGLVNTSVWQAAGITALA